jgi:glycosyltransferase involved in cell wall biosynthesis
VSTSLEEKNTAERVSVNADVQQGNSGIAVSLLTGGFDRPYAFGLAMALAAEGIHQDVVGSDEIDSPEMHNTPRLKFLNLLENTRSSVSLVEKAIWVLRFYARLLRYVVSDAPRILHILWNNKFQYFDRTLLTLFYKVLGKKIVLTVHNVNTGKRDGNDSPWNRFTLRVQYRLVDHIFVHTEKSKNELLQEFGVGERHVSIIPFGINNAVPNTKLSCAEARRQLGYKPGEKVILFFGAVRPYKGIEYLASAFVQLATRHPDYRLVIAGEPKKGTEEYVLGIQKILAAVDGAQVTQKLEFIPDEQTEVYFKASDVSVLPYTLVFQSGVLFLSYSFGLPVIASDVGSFKEDILEGETGFVCRPRDVHDLAATIEKYFESDLFSALDSGRRQIRDCANRRNSWRAVGETTRQVYTQLLKGERR